MRLVTYEARGVRGVGVVIDDRIVETGFTDMLELIGGGPVVLEGVRSSIESCPTVEDARILAPIPRPHLIVFHSINFPSIVEETAGCEPPTRSSWFSKLPTSIIGPGDAIRKPFQDTHLDWEVELAIVIGKACSRASAEDALDYVFGYTVVNDISARDIQIEGGDIMLGKGADTFCPMGPAIVTSDEIPDPARLSVSTYLNGERVQHDSLAHMYYSVGENLAALTRLVTLQPGDIVTTGTPGGIGMNMKPPRWLVPGDVSDVEADVIGRISNPVIPGW
jgi:2-keto-4-pentenoate hydratase/2-oxohepta-3-ene-1,7-dioic acid hydratase in catechol pathway